MSKALSTSLEVPSSPGTYSAALEGLTGVNEVLMRRDPSIPPLYSAAPRWEVREGDPSELRWRYAPEIATTGWGDCQDLSAYRAAELRVHGGDPQAHVRVYPTGPNRYHAVVARGNGLIEDPSAILGMNPIPEAPMVISQLPVVAGPNGGPTMVSVLRAALGGIQQHLNGMHPTRVDGGGVLGPVCGPGPQLARLRDVAPEVRGPTFHVAPHQSKSGPGWKGIHRVPLKDGSAIVGMTRTYAHPADVIGEGAGIISSIGHAILNHPILTGLLAPEALIAASALSDPTVQYSLNATGAAARNAARAAAGASRPNSGSGGDGWPSNW